MPFDSEGADALGLTTKPAEGIRRVLGTLRSSDTDVLVQDAWANDPYPWRAATACDFLIAPESGPSVIVSLGLAPIVIAPPRSASLESIVGAMDPRQRRLLPPRLASAREKAEMAVVELRVGDVVEVIGVSRPIQQSSRRLDRVGYRDAARPCDVIGDEDGTRVVLRLVREL